MHRVSLFTHCHLIFFSFAGKRDLSVDGLMLYLTHGLLMRFAAFGYHTGARS